MQTNTPTTEYTILTKIILVIVLFTVIHYISAWTAPTGVAPANNVLPPINEGTGIQVKNGGLGVTNFVANSIVVGSTTNANAITSPKFCIGTSCITSWPTGSSSTSTGGGWVNVPLTDTSNFDVTCDYRVNFSGKIHYATNVFVSGIAITNDSLEYNIVYNQRSHGGAVTQIEKNCGGNVSSAGGGWVNVPLTDTTSSFDEMCDYKVKYKFAMYANGPTPYPPGVVTVITVTPSVLYPVNTPPYSQSGQVDPPNYPIYTILKGSKHSSVFYAPNGDAAPAQYSVNNVEWIKKRCE